MLRTRTVVAVAPRAARLVARGASLVVVVLHRVLCERRPSCIAKRPNEPSVAETSVAQTVGLFSTSILLPPAGSRRGPAFLGVKEVVDRVTSCATRLHRLVYSRTIIAVSALVCTVVRRKPPKFEIRRAFGQLCCAPPCGCSSCSYSARPPCCATPSRNHQATLSSDGGSGS